MKNIIFFLLAYFLIFSEILFAQEKSIYEILMLYNKKVRNIKNKEFFIFFNKYKKYIFYCDSSSKFKVFFNFENNKYIYYNIRHNTPSKCYSNYIMIYDKKNKHIHLIHTSQNNENDNFSIEQLRLSRVYDINGFLLSEVDIFPVIQKNTINNKKEEYYNILSKFYFKISKKYYYYILSQNQGNILNLNNQKKLGSFTIAEYINFLSQLKEKMFQGDVYRAYRHYHILKE